MAAVDRFQSDAGVRVALCNIIAGGVGITLTAGTHVIFQDLDWVPANHAQAEDRCYRMGQRRRVSVDYMIAAGTLDRFISELPEAKMALIAAVEPDRLAYAQLCDAPIVAPDDAYADALDGRSTLGDGGLPIRELVEVLPAHTALSMEIRSAALRSAFRDASDRARHVLATTTAWFDAAFSDGSSTRSGAW